MSFRCLQRALCTAVKAASTPSLPGTMHPAAAATGCGFHPSRAVQPRWAQQKQRINASTGYRRHNSTVTTAAAAPQAPAAQQGPPLDLETVLSRVRVAVQGSQPLWRAPANNNVSVLQNSGLSCDSVALLDHRVTASGGETRRGENSKAGVDAQSNPMSALVSCCTLKSCLLELRQLYMASHLAYSGAKCAPCLDCVV